MLKIRLFEGEKGAQLTCDHASEINAVIVKFPALSDSYVLCIGCFSPVVLCVYEVNV